MISRLHKRLGTAGLVVAIAALVLALTGAAFAASGALSSKQKKEVEKIAKKFQGTGPTGLQGAAGANGKDGAQGPEGKQGEQGKQGIQGIQGKEGNPWSVGGTLPAGESETGTWAFGVEGTTGENIQVPISINIPLGAGLTAAQVHYINPAGKELVEENFELKEITPTACGTAIEPGVNAANPKADPGNLCVYAGSENNVIVFDGLIENPGTEAPGAGVSGSIIKFFPTGSGAFGHGSWAVTEEE